MRSRQPGLVWARPGQPGKYECSGGGGSGHGGGGVSSIGPRDTEKQRDRETAAAAVMAARDAQSRVKPRPADSERGAQKAGVAADAVTLAAVPVCTTQCTHSIHAIVVVLQNVMATITRIISLGEITEMDIEWRKARHTKYHRPEAGGRRICN